MLFDLASPARSGYIEITPKRVNKPSVSVFLNDRAAIGMTVEATGPSGQFCLTPADRKTVLLAAGSGITPMMAMLRYLDDLCLDTQARLFVLRSHPRRHPFPAGIGRIARPAEELSI